MTIALENTEIKTIHLGVKDIPYIIIKGEKYINLDYKKE